MVYLVALLKIVGSILLLAAPILLWSLAADRLERAAATKAGQQRCLERGWEFVKVTIHQNHFALVCRDQGRPLRCKFRMRHLFGRPRSVQWLPDPH